MASGTGNLPNQNMDFTPFDILTAEEMDDLVENIESLADGSGIGDGAIDTTQLADGAVTHGKIDFTTLSTAEKEVGRWIDGKTIYQRVFSGNISASANARNSESIATGGIDSLISSKGYWAVGSSGIIAVIGGHDPTGRSSTVARGSDGVSITLVTQSNFARTSEPYVVAVEYTKA